MSEPQEMSNFVYPDRHGFVAREIRACLRIDRYPAVKILPVGKLCPSHNARLVQHRLGPGDNGDRA